MFEENSFKSFMIGFLSYFVISIILDFLGIEKLFIKVIILSIMLLLSYLIINRKKSNK